MWIIKLIREIVPTMLFFFVAFSLVDIGAILKFKSTLDISYSFFVIFVSSLVMAKIVLLSDYLPFTHAFSKKPLIYNTVWKTTIYVVISFFVRFLERFVPAYLHAKSIEVAYAQVIPAFTDLMFWASEIWLAILLVIYVACRELTTAIGKDKIRTLFFG
jgi:hypothetical protein